MKTKKGKSEQNNELVETNESQAQIVPVSEPAHESQAQIEPAERIQLTKENFEEVKSFVNDEACHESYGSEKDYEKKVNPIGLVVPTVDGLVLAKIGNYITKDSEKGFLVSESEVLEVDYEENTSEAETASEE